MSQIKVKRRIPSPKDLAQLLKFRKVIFSPRKRRLSRALTIYDLRDIAKRRTPQAPFDYTDGGADTETSLTRARAAYEKLEFQPKILLNELVLLNYPSLFLKQNKIYPMFLLLIEVVECKQLIKIKILTLQIKRWSRHPRSG